MNKVAKQRLARLDRLVKAYEEPIAQALLRDLETCIVVFAATGDILLSVSKIDSKHLQSVLDQILLDVIQREARLEYLHLVGERKALPSLPVDEWLRRAKQFIAVESSKAIVAINSYTRAKVRKVLRDTVTAGKSIPDTVKQLRNDMPSFSRSRANSIARTELIGALNYGSYCGAATTGVALDKFWISTSDGRTRVTHLAASGQTVDLNSGFIVGGEQCRFPGDPALSASNRIRCRCCIGFRPKKKPGQQLNLFK